VGHVDRHLLLAQVEGAGLRGGHLEERLGQDVLAGVLLHVIESARPIHTAIDGSSREFAVNDMYNIVAVVANIQNQGRSQSSDIVGLASGSGIERGPVQEHFPRGPRARISENWAGRKTRKDSRLEILNARIVVIEPMRGHQSAILAQSI
jgi:hypothetical protein